jgi:hypothetical protein
LDADERLRNYVSLVFGDGEGAGDDDDVLLLSAAGGGVEPSPPGTSEIGVSV